MKYKDKIGMWTSFACLIHCLALPLIVSVMPALSILDAGMEVTFIIIAFSIGSISFIDNIIKHKYYLSLILFVIGFSFILMAKTQSLEYFNFIGLFTLIIAHYLNFKKIKAVDGSHPHGCCHNK